MAGEWIVKAIGDIATVVGGSTPSTRDPANFDGDIPWLTPKDLAGPHPRYITRGERNLSRMGLESCSAQILPANSVLLSSRAPIGYLAIAKNPLATNQGFRSLVVKPGYDHEFIYYWLFANVAELERHATGSTFKELSGSALKQIRLRLPSALHEQRAIAHILGTLDDKIELNRRMSETLEAMARALFKAWFVDFEPVRAKMEGRWRRGQSLPGLPAHLYDLFPDRLVESELGEIPEGWGVGALGDVADNPRRGIQPNSIQPDTPYIALEHMPKRCITLSDWGIAAGLESNKFEFRRGEILFGKLRPYFHKVGVAPVDGVCSTDIVVVAPKSSGWFGFVLGHVSSVEFVEYTNAGSTGTKMPRTSWAEMARYAVALPPQAVTRAFTERLQPFVAHIIAGVHESRTLAQLRDTLLPKLISGELRVPDAERIVGGAV
ncbi:restriction endonuclease subunit S [Caldimonas manganoxidans]|uniref:restriction endonuclease subunit S n=1 Tax=Caldimonas manganoxidans TaxID=196015 RepID=UPI000380ACB0|nr:restriction endonuclease subunit S [Caldimonas manganoxidans]